MSWRKTLAIDNGTVEFRIVWRASCRTAVHARELAERIGRIVDAISGRQAVLPEASAGGDPVGN